MTIFEKLKLTAALCGVLTLAACQSTSTGTTSSGSAPDNAQFFDGQKMTGKIYSRGCRSTWSPDWQADLIDGKLVGHMMSSRSDNEPDMAQKVQKFSIPVEADGTFGARSGKGPHRLWLRWWASSKSGYGSKSPGKNKRMAHKYSGREGKYQWVSGQVLKNGDIKIYVKWGTSLGHGTCDGKAYFKNSISDEQKIMAAIENDPKICEGDKTEFDGRKDAQIQSLKADGSISKGKDFSNLDFRLGRLYKAKCSA